MMPRRYQDTLRPLLVTSLRGRLCYAAIQTGWLLGYVTLGIGYLYVEWRLTPYLFTSPVTTENRTVALFLLTFFSTVAGILLYWVFEGPIRRAFYWLRTGETREPDM